MMLASVSQVSVKAASPWGKSSAIEAHPASFDPLCAAPFSPRGTLPLNLLLTLLTAEDHLLAAQSSPGHLLQLLHIIATPSGTDAAVVQAAAVRFKNVVSKGWDTHREDGNDGIVISPEDRSTIKTHLVELMCKTPAQIQLQLSESISLIAAVDYPAQWNNLLPELVKQLGTNDSTVLHGVLKTADSIFLRFRGVQRSDELYAVLKYTLEAFQKPLLALYNHLGQSVAATTNDKAALTANFESLTILSHIYYSLNYQDLPEFFEDNMEAFMVEFKKYLQYKNPILEDPNEEDEPSPVDKLQAAIIDILELYASKDEEPFLVFLPELSSMVWNLLIGASNLPKNDILVTKSIKFLSLLVQREMHRGLFKEEATLRQIVLNIVIPNLMFRESDEERFEDDPREYIVTEVEGSDSESRRRCSQDLLKAMCRKFEAETTAICSEQINLMLADYATDPANKWKSKDAAIQLMMGISIRRESTQYGVSEISQGVNVLEFFQAQVLPELQDCNHASRPVVKATALKFVSTFRNQFTKQHLIELIRVVIVHLGSPVVVCHTFAAYTLERILMTKEAIDGEGSKTAKITSAELREFLDPLFSGLFTIIDNTEQNENDYAMKCVMRSLFTAGQDVVPVTQSVIEKLTGVLIRVAKNPRNPQFNHYLFESIAVLVKNVCSQSPEATAGFEPLLFKPFTDILQQDIVEFTPYVFQVLAQLLEYRPASSGLGDAYTALFTPLLKPEIWEHKGNVPALARLVAAYISKASDELVSQLTPILGVCQKLISLKSTEVSAFDILSAVVIHIPQAVMTPYLKPLLEVLLNRLQIGKTPRYCRLVTTFFALLVGKYTPQAFMEATNSIQVGVAAMLLGQVWNKRMLQDPPVQLTEAKIQVVGLTRLLCETPEFLADQNVQHIWAETMVGLIMLLTSDNVFKKNAGPLELDTDIEPIGYDAVYSRLVFASKKPEDPFANVVDPQQFFVKSLHALLSQKRNQVLPLIQQGLTEKPDLSGGLQAMFQQAGLNLSG